MKKLYRICPICENQTGDVLHTQHFTLPENSPLPEFYDVVSCNNCGFCFADTNTSQNWYDMYYNQMSKYEDKITASGGALNEIDKNRLATASDIIYNNNLQKDARILDIGCANGGLLTCLKNLGFNNLTGIDITETCIKNVKDLGFNSYFGGIFNLENIKNKKFDIIILSHVLEHVRDLAKAIINVKSLLKFNGFIYVEVPDASRYKNYFVVPYYYFDCEHINHFDSESLKNLIEDNNVECTLIDEREIFVSKSTPYPVVSAVFRKNRFHSKTQIIQSFKVRESINFYVNLSKQKSNYHLLRDLVENKNEVLVWGAGMYTLRLLQDSPLSKCNIISFLDKDSKKQGNKINNVVIQNPYKVLTRNKNIPVIVSSALFGQ